jgi:hypothetical protein
MFLFNLNVVFHNELFKNGTNPCALYPRISSRSRISRIGICVSVVRNNYVKNAPC